MNLIHDSWLPVRRFDGTKESIAPWQILAKHDTNPVLALDYPRPDFNGALTQFLIGLLQTCCEVDAETWAKWLFNPLTADEIQARFNQVAEEFELDGNGPRFMQDFDKKMEGTLNEVETLLIEAPGGNTIKKNLDHFVKRERSGAMCKSCVATALFTLQLNAPLGGAGHRTGLRGGGPLTALLQILNGSTHAESPILFTPFGPTLFHQLWLNVLDSFSFLNIFPDFPETGSPFPWMKSTRTSSNGEIVTPQDAHPLTIFWGMPRRIRLDFDSSQKGNCSVCGKTSEELIQHYITKNHGENYDTWMHPLSPYYQDKEQAWLPSHPQPGGIGYRHWLDLTSEQDKRKQAAVISRFFELRYKFRKKVGFISLWAFGFDMDNMKPRGWHESKMPLFVMADSGKQTLLTGSAEMLIAGAKEVQLLLRQQIKKAWFSPKRKVSGNTSFIDITFWSATETSFFQQVEQFQQRLENDEDLNEINFTVMKQWQKDLSRVATEIFDRWAESGNTEFGNFRRVAIARNDLQKRLRGANLRKILGLPQPKKKSKLKKEAT